MSGAELDRAPPPAVPSDAVRGEGARQDPAAPVRGEATARVPDARTAGFAAALRAAREELAVAETAGDDRPGAPAHASDEGVEGLEEEGGEALPEEEGAASGGPAAASPPAGVRPPLADVPAAPDAAEPRAGELALGGVAATDRRALDPPSMPAAGSTAPALDAAAIGTLMSDLRALDAPPSGQWRFAMPGNADGLGFLVLSRGESGAWNLRLGTDRGRGAVSRGELDGLRDALRERGHDVDGIVQDTDDGGLGG